MVIYFITLQISNHIYMTINHYRISIWLVICKIIKFSRYYYSMVTHVAMVPEGGGPQLFMFQHTGVVAP